MKNSKGFIIPLIILVIAVGALGGGYYYYTNTIRGSGQSEASSNMPNQQATQPANPVAPNKGVKVSDISIRVDGAGADLSVRDISGKTTGIVGTDQRVVKEIPHSTFDFFTDYTSQEIIVDYQPIVIFVKARENGKVLLSIKPYNYINNRDISVREFYYDFQLEKGEQALVTIQNIDSVPKLTISKQNGSTKNQTVNFFELPIADAGNSQTVKGGSKVILDASMSHDYQGRQLVYNWAQLTDEPKVEISNPHSIKPSFIAPSVTKDTFLNFALLVVADNIASKIIVVSILVKP